MDRKVVEMAKQARLNAWAPYSDFQVGAVLETKSGKIYTGCNIENHGIQGICAERTAFAKALSEGERDFARITIVGAKKGYEPTEECLPCGYCRQFMSEFVDDNFKIRVFDGSTVKEYTMAELLPHGFKIKYNIINI